MAEAKGQGVGGCACLGGMVGVACVSRGIFTPSWRPIDMDNVDLITVLLWAAMVLVTVWIIRARVPHQVSWARAFALIGPWVLLYLFSLLIGNRPARLFGVIGQGTVETTISLILLLGVVVKTLWWEYAEGTAECPVCEYSTHALTGTRCPECGHQWIAGQTYPRLRRRRARKKLSG